MQLILELTLGFLLIIFTFVIHSAGMYLVMHKFELNCPRYLHEKNEFRRQFYFGQLVIGMVLTHILEVFVIALVLYGIDAMSNLRTAFYFTGETYTTLGFGDILLPTGWRQLALFIAMSGLFTFGWSTGVLVSIVGKTYEAQFSNLRKRNQ
jgi:hypothetical protein